MIGFAAVSSMRQRRHPHDVQCSESLRKVSIDEQLRQAVYLRIRILARHSWFRRCQQNEATEQPTKPTRSRCGKSYWLRYRIA